MKKGVKRLRDYQTRPSSSPTSREHSLPPTSHSTPHQPLSHFFVRLFSFFIVFLLIILILAVFFKSLQQEKTPVQQQGFLSISDLRCTPVEDQNEICGTFRWSGDYGDYVIPSIGGAITAPTYETKEPFFEHCARVASSLEQSYHLAKLTRYSAEGYILDSKELSVSCPALPTPIIFTPPSPILPSSYSQKVQFQAKRDVANKADAFGTFAYTFPQPIQSCTVSNGAYTINDDPYLQSYVGYCNKAKGTFVSTADAYLQSTIVDPSPFKWEGQVLIDPLPVTLPYFGFAEICDHTYMTKDRNYIRLGLTGFGTKTLTLDWTYKDQTGNRIVDFLFTLECTPVA